MRLEFLDMLLSARDVSGFRDKVKAISAVIIQVIGSHSGMMRISNKLTNYLLADVFVWVGDCRFYLADAPSLFVISPRFENFVDSWFEVNDGDVVVDVGAHIGKYSLRFAKKAEKVIAIEPNRETYGISVRNIEANDFRNISALNVAAWNERTELVLFSGSDSGQHSLKRESHRSEIVQADTLDSIVLQSKLVKVDWIKVDVEQAEAEV
jgi:FkbM family methyltransferase